MKLLLDSAIIEEARKAAEWGWVSGVTTNPALLAQSGLSPDKTFRKLIKLFVGPIFYQITGSTLNVMEDEAKIAAGLLGKQLVLKIPATELGFKATTHLSKKYKCAVTSIFTPAQAMVAHAAGARYALYYHNRAKRLLENGEELAAGIFHALKGTNTRVVAASLKTPQEVFEARTAGVKILSKNLKVLAQMMTHEYSEAAIEEFIRLGTGLIKKSRRSDMKILVTGGAGYIGSTICSALLDAGHTPVILDSLVTGSIEFTKDRIFYKGDIADSSLIRRIFSEHSDIYASIHCAALIIVPESTTKPYEYYRENVGKSLELFHTLKNAGCRRLVFSSSASIYDVVPGFMVTESAPLRPNSPYARTKYMMEMILRDFCAAYSMQGIALRYFNPIGADPNMRTGLQIANPSHAIGKLVDVQLGKISQFTITGTDYETRDGTGIRDYIHVWNLAQAHVRAVENFDKAFSNAGDPSDNYLVINLGTGRGVTVRELVTAFEAVVGKEINKADGLRRPGDTAGSFCNADTAKRLLGWKADLSIKEGISDALKWGAMRDSVLID